MVVLNVDEARDRLIEALKAETQFKFRDEDLRDLQYRSYPNGEQFIEVVLASKPDAKVRAIIRSFFAGASVWFPSRITVLFRTNDGKLVN